MLWLVCSVDVADILFVVLKLDGYHIHKWLCVTWLALMMSLVVTIFVSSFRIGYHVASDQGLHCLLTVVSIKYRMKATK